MMVMGLMTLVQPAHATWTTNVSYTGAPRVASPAKVKRVVLIDPAAKSLNAADRTSLDLAVRQFKNQAGSAPNLEVVYVSALDRRDLSVSPDYRELAAIAKAHRAQAVVSFDALRFEMGPIQMTEVSVDVNRDGRVVREKRQEAKQRIDGVLTVRYVDPFARTVILSDDVGHHAVVAARSKARATARRDVAPKASRQKADLAVSGARWFGNQIFATRMTGKRSFFANGKLKEGRKYAAVGKWIEARNHWRNHWDNGKRSGMKARYNVAVTFEVRGNVRQALKVLDPLVGRWNHSMVTSYHRKLKQRVANLDRLESQGLR